MKAAPIVGGWFSWFASPTAPRVLAIRNPLTRKTRWLGPRPMTGVAASNWQADELERNWGSTVNLYTWTGSTWTPGA